MFIPQADLPAFHRMLMDIRRLQHPDENFAIEDEYAAGAWDRAFKLWSRLCARAAREEQQAVVQNRAFAADEAEWAEYIGSRQQILEMLKRGILDEGTLTEHLDVKLPDDLASPTPAPQIVRQHDPWCPTMQTGKASDCKCAARATEEHKPNGFGPDNRPVGWRARSSRLSAALRWWGALGAEARDAIKTQRALKKLQQFKQERAHG